jgi:energy-coupling factor transporter ATP-binding protein EcfA2
VSDFVLTIDNFQSIAHADLVFKPGITMIVGQSNSGKTAIFRAIMGMLTNPTKAKYRIKHGTNELSVNLRYDNNAIVWKRNAKSGSSYEVNGQEYQKIGTQDLFDILENNGFIRDWDDNVMNVEGEWNLPFPFDRTPAETFRLFENVLCVTDSAIIMKSFKDDELEASRARASLTEKGKGIKHNIKVLDDLEKEVDLENIKSKAAFFEKHINKYTQSQQDMVTIKHCAKAAALDLDEVLPPKEFSLQKYIEMSSDYADIVKVAAMDKFFKTIPEHMDVPESLDVYIASKEDLEYCLKVLKLNKFTKSLPPAYKQTDSLDKYIEMSADYEEAVIGSKYNNFDLGEEYVITEDLTAKYQALVEDLEVIKLAQTASTVDIPDEDCELCSSDTLNQYLEMSADYESVMQIFLKCKALKKNIKDKTEIISGLETKLKSYKVCPLCGHELNGDHIDE